MAYLNSMQSRLTIVLAGFFLLVVLATLAVVHLFVTPGLERSEGEIVEAKVGEVSERIRQELQRVEAQQRAITQVVASVESADIDKVLPGLIDQYGDVNVAGGGVWPLPGKREPGRDKFSSFLVRQAGSGKLEVNDYWNTPDSLKYWEQSWYDNGVKAPRGACGWSKAFADAASPQPRTACGMGIYKGSELYGVSTINVSLAFFNALAAETESRIHGQILIVEADGKVVSNTSYEKEPVVMRNVSDLAGHSPMAAKLQQVMSAAESGAAQKVQFESEGEPHTMFVRPIPGSPWFLAASLPTRLLTQDSDRILGRLAMAQLPMLCLMLLVALGSVRYIMRRLVLLRTNMDALSSGDADLTRRLPLGAGFELDAVATSLNTFLARLQEMLKQVASSTGAIASASREVSVGNADLSLRTEHQASSLQETAASIEDISSSTQRNAESARLANSLASDASNAVSEGGVAFAQVVNTMESISESSRKISEIIGVIDGIAFQTNILALNAAVESARAGEQGRGFAVVAAEVRGLAQRSASAAKEIKALIVDSAKKVDAGTVLVDTTGRRMEAITQQVKGFATLATEILAASQAQQTGIEQINQTMRHLDANTQQNAAMVEEASAATYSLEEQAVKLDAVVAGFHL